MVSYELKANLTTLISTYLIPVLVGYGVSYESANALTGVIVALIIIGFGILNERYTSSHLTKEMVQSNTASSEVEEIDSSEDMNSSNNTEGC